MLVLVTGTPGSGKSYYAVRKALASLEAGKFLATNVAFADGWAESYASAHPLRWAMPGRRAQLAARWRERTFISDELDELFRLRMPGRQEGRGVMVLDEAHNWMNSRLWKDSDRLDVVRFFTQHRKLGWDVYLITQDANNIDRQVRTLFEYHVTLRNLRRMKLAGIPVSPVNLFLAIWKWNGAGGAITRREAYRLNSTAKLYDTLAVSHGLEDDETEAIWLPLDSSAPAPAPAPATASAPSGLPAGAPRRAADVAAAAPLPPVVAAPVRPASAPSLTVVPVAREGDSSFTSAPADTLRPVNPSALDVEKAPAGAPFPADQREVARDGLREE